MLTIKPELGVGDIISILSAVIGIVIAVGRLSQKLEQLRGDLHDVVGRLNWHIKDDSRRFEDPRLLAEEIDRLQQELTSLRRRMGCAENAAGAANSRAEWLETAHAKLSGRVGTLEQAGALPDAVVRVDGEAA